VEAAEAAISNPLLDDISMKGARAVLINITGGPDLGFYEVDEAANRIREEVDAEANIIFGANFDETMEGRMRVAVIATGIDVPVRTATHETTQQSAPQQPQIQQPREEQQSHTGFAQRPAAQDHGRQPEPARARLGLGWGLNRPTVPQQSAPQQPVEQQPAPQQVETTSLQQTAPVSGYGRYAPTLGRDRAHQQPVSPSLTPTATLHEADAYAEAQKADEAANAAAARGEIQSIMAEQRDAQMPTANAHEGDQTLLDATDVYTPRQSGPRVVADNTRHEQPTAHGQQAQKRGSSLFERVTGLGRGRREDEERRTPAPAQADLAFDRPSAPRAGQHQDDMDDIDIPAFLRRQAN